MGEYYLRLEAVNLANFVYDTSDLSTMRGGSQFVAVAGTVVENAVTGLEAISTGASAVLWSFDAVSDDAAKAVRKVAEKALRDDSDLMHATFVVDTVPANGGFRHVSESALALNRHRQMVAPSIAVPKTSSNWVCQLDGVRPAVREIKKGKEKKWVSESVSRRREFGKLERHQVVRLAAKRIELDVRESKEFFDIAGNAPKGVGNLDGKMAVLFLDGNDFGALQREKCNIREQQREYDLALKEASKRILDSLLLEAKRNPCQWVNGEVLRLEVLMLAGDEIRIVVPAWCGWIALQRIFETVEELPKVLGKKLTWKAGLLFCQHHAPIRRMLGLADLLAGFAKDNSGSGPAPNVMAYRVLESFDVPGSTGPKFLRQELAKAELVLQGDDLEEIAALVQFVRKRFPRNKLHRIVELHSNAKADEAEIVIKKELGELSDEDQNRIVDRRVLVGKTGWLHFLELADYALESPSGEGEVTHA